MKKSLLLVLLLFSTFKTFAQVAVIVKDMSPGSASSNFGKSYQVTTDAFYFYTFSRQDGSNLLWQSDGTEEGTRVINKSFYNTSYIEGSKNLLADVGNYVYFAAADTEFATELWKLDKQTGERSIVKDISLGGKGSSPDNFHPFKGKLLFTASQTRNGSYVDGLWITDGTEQSTTLLKDLYFYQNNKPLELNGIFYFIASASESRANLWRTDGTPEGTYAVSNVCSYCSAIPESGINELNGKLYFSVIEDGNTAVTNQLWTSDGNIEGTNKSAVELNLHYFDNITKNLGKLTFNATEINSNNLGFYATDGTSAGTYLVKDDSSYSPIVFKKKLYIAFNNYTQQNKHLWSTDMDATAPDIKIISGTSAGQYLLSTDSVLYFSSEGQLARTDGTQTGTYLLNEINPGLPFNPDNMFVFNKKIFFTGYDGVNGRELFHLTPSTNTVQGIVYLDANQNGTLDTYEKGLANQQVLILPDSMFTYTKSNGYFSAHLKPGNYTVKILPSNDWRFVAGNGTYSVTLPDTRATKLTFGLAPKVEEKKASVTITGNQSRCSTEVGYLLSTTNTGNTITNSQLSLTLDPGVEYVTSTPAPSTRNGVNLSWNVADLYPGQAKPIKLLLRMPDFNSMGDTIRFYSQASLTGTNIIAKDTLEQIITCSYDPNDKLVKPTGLDEQHLTLKNSWLDYTIRFQNTGNDTAFVVVLKDTLDANLDLKSFEVLGSSHTMQASRKERALAFRFEDIKLPDSTRDEPNSHGFVRYRIKAKAGVAENTVVENKAYIFFDFNPAVETNTTFNTLVTTLPQRVVNGWQEHKLQEIRIYPNPAKGSFTLQAEAPMEQVQIFSSIGKLLYQQTFNHSAQEQTLSAALLPPGLYLVIVTAGKKQYRQTLIKK